MAFESEFLSMMPHRVTLEAVLTRDKTGKPATYAAPVTYRARITGKVLSLRKTDRGDATVVFDVYLDCGDDVIRLDDRLTLDGDPAWVDGTPMIFAVARSTDDDGHHHVKLQCGWMYHRQGQ